MNRYICIHGHFYQPLRENPWTNKIDNETSAFPYNDWNQRITAECYKPNLSAPIIDKKGTVIKRINNYTKINFDFGPTLLAWLEKNEPEVYTAIIESDQQSQKNFAGNGSAIAQAYNHIIMPLGNEQDKRTQVYWAIKDFEYRFKRKPIGIWLPETAVDIKTLEILAELDIKFTILSPHQAKRTRKIGSDQWIETNGNIDTKQVYLCKLPSTKTINLFFYNKTISTDVAFNNLLSNGEVFAQRLGNEFMGDTRPQLVHIATDGETYGHHHRFGEMALAYCLDYIETNQLAHLTNYSEYLAKYPAEYEVEIIENTSWSCAHGIERWRSNCGCCTGTHPNWHQNWRTPLRNAMDWLRDKIIEITEPIAHQYTNNFWHARNDYIEILLNPNPVIVSQFINKHCKKELSSQEITKLLKILEIQYNTLLMFTSCGWYFDDISGLETIQILRYAGRAIQLTREITSIDLESEYQKMLESAPSNVEAYQNGSKVYEIFVRPYTSS
ncbi:MAG: DUF3536 domain-containing protein [candidate division WOR-3 bacterium]|nr:DUF3536 domain-containing protein [candidate division WOR-3 bacterium]